ncbi:AMP-dependent synthetase [Candidatus Geothermarchaeota archaeon]|nr:MAG: AMP-dependent synthetase [Candidatus Geothermarchaeota archaeon]
MVWTVPRNYELTLDKILYRAIDQFPDVEVVYKDQVRYNYREFYRRVKLLASALEAIGLKDGAKIATAEWNTHRHFEAYFAIPMMGNVLHTINVAIAPMDIGYILSHAGDDAIMINEDFLPFLNVLKDYAKTIKKVIILTDKKNFEPPKIEGIEVYEYEFLLRDYGDESYEFLELSEDTVATMMYTSGTTGLPKGVYFTHRQLVLHSLATSIQFFYPGITLSYKDVAMSLVPMFHVHSWGLPYTFTLLGVKQVFPGKFDFGLILKLIDREKVTFTAGVPTILHMLLYHPESKNYDLSGLKMVIGGAALPRGLYEEARRRGMIVISGYGLTETAPVLTVANLKPYMEDWPEEKKAEIFMRTGFPLPIVELRVVDDKFNDVPKDGKTMGEIIVRAPWVAREYYKDPEKTKEAYVEGWFRTGDVAVWFEDGYIKIVDRYKDVIKSGGEWISSITLESLISIHPGVSEVAVIGKPHEKWGERPLAIIVPKPEYKGKLSEDDIKSHLMKFVDEGRIPKWWIPDYYEFVDELPKTGTGKINKRELRAKYLKA